jgi:hypothetical protein
MVDGWYQNALKAEGEGTDRLDRQRGLKGSAEGCCTNEHAGRKEEKPEEEAEIPRDMVQREGY